MSEKSSFKELEHVEKASHRRIIMKPTMGNLTFEQVLDASNNGVIVTDECGSVLFINDKTEEILEFDKKNVLNSNISDILPLTGQLVMKSMKSGKPQIGEQVIGQRVSLVVNTNPIWQNEQVCGSLCSFQKVEQLENVAKQLESYKRLINQLETIFSSSSDGLWVADSDGTIISYNDAAAKLNNINPEEIIGRNTYELVEKGKIDRSATIEALESKRRVTIMQYVKNTGKHLLITATPVFDDDGKISMVVGNERDLTQLNALQEQLEQNRMVTEKYKEEITELSMLELKKHDICAKSQEMRQVLRVVLKLARMEVSHILILGETGTGKGLLAKYIHKNSPRSKKPFIQINCAALPETLLEAELFGYEKGAFTGAKVKGKIGLFELANEGTLFLDEIGDLPFPVQAKLLKYLDDNEIMRLGGVEPQKIDCVVISATNRDIESFTQQDKFRKDLFYRLNPFTIQIPPLRKRPEDIFELVSHYLQRYNKEYKQEKRISANVIPVLRSYPFGGNVRELKNVIQRAVVMSDEELLDDVISKSFEKGVKQKDRPGRRKNYVLGLNEELKAVEKEIFKIAMKHCRTTREMADYLRVSQATVIRRLRKHGLSSVTKG